MFNDIRYLLAVTMLDKVGPVLAREILSYFGNAEQLFMESAASLRKIPRVGPVLAREIYEKKALERADKEIDFLIKNNISVCVYTSKNYPQRLLNCDDAPLLFFYKGKVDFNAQKIISIVGTRNATEYGIEACENIIKDLAPHNPIIVSGLAFGIDITAHKVALQNGLQTISVIGGPMHRITPSTHIKVAHNIMSQGCVMTEYHTQMGFEKALFVRRNRIIAGISDATIVIESKIKGGALITADLAHEYSRDVFAIPGKINTTYSAGCNNLIKENKAALIENATDIEKQLNWDLEKRKSTQRQLFITLHGDEEVIYNTLNNKELTIDAICNSSGIAMNKTSSILLSLEFQGLIKALPGKRFKRI